MEVTVVVIDVVKLAVTVRVTVEVAEVVPVVVTVLLSVLDWDVVAVLDLLVVAEVLADVVTDDVTVEVCEVVGEVASHAAKSPAASSAIAFVSRVAVLGQSPVAGSKSKSPLQTVVPFVWKSSDRYAALMPLSAFEQAAVLGATNKFAP